MGPRSEVPRSCPGSPVITDRTTRTSGVSADSTGVHRKRSHGSLYDGSEIAADPGYLRRKRDSDGWPFNHRAHQRVDPRNRSALPIRWLGKTRVAEFR